MSEEMEENKMNKMKNERESNKGGDIHMTTTRKTELDFKEATLKYRCKETGLIEVRSANLQEWFEDEEYDLISFETEEMNNLRHLLEHLVLGLYDADKEFQTAIDSLNTEMHYVLTDFVRDVKKNLNYQRHIIKTHLLDIKSKSL